MSQDKQTVVQGGKGGMFGVNGGRGQQGDVAIDGVVYTPDHPEYERMRQQATQAMANRIRSMFGGTQ